MDEKRFRFDLFIALFALAISAVAAGASAYQTYVIRQQFSATVWPYLTFTTSSSADSFVDISLNNPGIGPALIRSVAVLRDGKRIEAPSGTPALALAIASEETAAHQDESQPGYHGKSSLTVTGLVKGDVIPAGGSVHLLRVDGKFFARRLLASARRIDLDLCYCSLLGTCWTKRYHDATAEPHPVARCPEA